MVRSYQGGSLTPEWQLPVLKQVAHFDRNPTFNFQFQAKSAISLGWLTLTGMVAHFAPEYALWFHQLVSVFFQLPIVCFLLRSVHLFQANRCRQHPLHAKFPCLCKTCQYHPLLPSCKYSPNLKSYYLQLAFAAIGRT